MSRREVGSALFEKTQIKAKMSCTIIIEEARGTVRAQRRHPTQSVCVCGCERQTGGRNLPQESAIFTEDFFPSFNEV